MFLLINAPSENNLDINDTSLESPINGLLKARLKLGMAPSYGLPCPLELKSTMFSRIDLTSLSVEKFPISKLESIIMF